MERTLTGNDREIVILGAGNVATHLAINLARHARISQIYNHNMQGAKALAAKVGSEPIDDLGALSHTAGLYIISVKDDAVAEIASALKGFGGLWAHTSGSVPMNALSPLSDTYGVFYPMQTFSKDVDVDMREVPLFIEGNSADTTERLKQYASLISDKVYEADSERRAKLHIAAVFACNFTNRLWDISARLLKELGLEFDTMKPLVEAMLTKACDVTPHEGQTGPARRKDMKIIQKHLDMLDGEEKELYSILSESIIKQYYPDEQDKL
ncbi:MAG: DUF2520 domain-containing protein [Muribaculum sp.]|nr:DUF2520 domain-containing protein [Muribaculum sp.]